MKLLVNTIDTFQAVGLTEYFKQYEKVGSPHYNTVGVIFNTETLLCAFIPAGGNVVFDQKVDASVGLKAILDILSGVEKLDTYFGHVVIRPHDRTVDVKNTDTLTFYDIENIRVKIRKEPTDDSLVGKVVTFGYTKVRYPRQRVVLVKEYNKTHLRGLDVLNDFQFKSFLQDRIEDLKVIK